MHSFLDHIQSFQMISDLTVPAEVIIVNCVKFGSWERARNFYRRVTPTFQDHWTHLGGGQVIREEFLNCLSDVWNILIRATYSTKTKISS